MTRKPPPGLVDDLRERLNAGDVTLVVGSGVSVAATGGARCASWRGLIEHGIEFCENTVAGLTDGWGDRARAQVEAGDLDELLAAAENVTLKLGGQSGGEYRLWLAQSVGQLQAVPPAELIEAIQALGAPLTTTNYDDLLAPGGRFVTWRDGEGEALPVIRRARKAVLHLHGHWQEPESVVRGIRSYEAALGNTVAQALLRALAINQTLLFVGFGAGLADPNFGRFPGGWPTDSSKPSTASRSRSASTMSWQAMRMGPQPNLFRLRWHSASSVAYGCSTRCATMSVRRTSRKPTTSRRRSVRTPRLR